MRHKTFDLDCSAGTAAGLARILHDYTEAAYPPGGSDCAQVAREALLDVARQCEAHPGGKLPLRRRMLAQIRAAVHWRLNAALPPDIELLPELGPLLEKTSGVPKKAPSQGT